MRYRSTHPHQADRSSHGHAPSEISGVSPTLILCRLMGISRSVRRDVQQHLTTVWRNKPGAWFSQVGRVYPLVPSDLANGVAQFYPSVSALASVRGLPCTVEFEGMPGIFGTIIFITAFAPANRA